MKEPKPSPCSECPFRRKSLPGYLGSATLEEFIVVATCGETPLPCHMEVNYASKSWEKLVERASQCTGHAIYLGNTCKMPRNEAVRTMKADHKAVFSSPQQFIEHHDQDKAAWAKKVLAAKKRKKKQ